MVKMMSNAHSIWEIIAQWYMQVYVYAYDLLTYKRLIKKQRNAYQTDVSTDIHHLPFHWQRGSRNYHQDADINNMSE